MVWLSHANDALNESLTRQSDDHQQEMKRLSHALEQRVERLEAVNSQQQTHWNSNPEPDTRSQFIAMSYTSTLVTMACPDGRTILTTSAVYGVFDSPNSECSGCCAPNPQYDCTELVEENSPSDWLIIQALCDGQELCQFEAPGTALGDCSSQLSDYMQLFYDCLPDDETGPVAFTAWANTGTSTSYSTYDVIVFDEILTNAGGHYNAATSSFICPWHGVYLMSVNIASSDSGTMNVDLMRNNDWLARVRVDAISDHHRGSTTIVTECDRGDVLWLKAAADGTVDASGRKSTFTGHILQRI